VLRAGPVIGAVGAGKPQGNDPGTWTH